MLSLLRVRDERCCFDYVDVKQPKCHTREYVDILSRGGCTDPLSADLFCVNERVEYIVVDVRI